MTRASGSADLPLHGGRVPAWLSERMTRLGRLIAEAVVLEYGRDELLARLAHPFWFQSFGAVMGMDWHSSGITTSVMGALKRGLAPIGPDLGLWVCGGRGRHSRKTPTELLELGERTGLPGDTLARTSRLVAKVDSAAVQDGFELYLHSFVVAADGKWVVVQQGMAPERRTARRYHWHSEQLGDSTLAMVDRPHAAIESPTVEGDRQRPITNLTDGEADPSRRAQVELALAGPDTVVETLVRLRDSGLPSPSSTSGPVAPSASPLVLPHLDMPAHHPVLAADVQLRRLHATLAAAADRGPKDFPELLLQPGVGVRAVLSLAMVAEVVHGAPHRFEDPGRFSLALGGKDGHPFPVPLAVYDRTLSVLRDAVDRARIGQTERIDALKRLDRQARIAEAWAERSELEGPSYEEFVTQERRRSRSYRGRTVLDDAEDARAARARRLPRRGRRGPQLGLFD